MVDSILAPIEKNPEVSIFYEELKPKPHYPFPWTADQFFMEAGRFGAIILKAVADDRFILTQTDLNARGAVTVNPALLIMGKRVSKVFKIWAHFIGFDLVEFHRMYARCAPAQSPQVFPWHEK